MIKFQMVDFQKLLKCDRPTTSLMIECSFSTFWVQLNCHTKSMSKTACEYSTSETQSLRAICGLMMKKIKNITAIS